MYLNEVNISDYPNRNKAALRVSVYNVDPDRPFLQISTPEHTYREAFLAKGFLGSGPSAAIIKKEYFDEVGGFSGKQFIVDTQLWHQLAWNYSVIKLQPHLIWWRRHAEQQIEQERKTVG